VPTPGSEVVLLVVVLLVVETAEVLSIRAMKMPVIATTPAQSQAPAANARSSIGFDRLPPPRPEFDITPPCHVCPFSVTPNPL
jgi:hypothetical protein